jgi:ABC-type branched-subunit amino acid transport system substrate-binding protein
MAAHAQAAEAGVGEHDIVVGQTLSLKAGKDAYGMAALEGIKLQLDQVNAAGGVNGRRIVLRTLDDEGKPALAGSNARQLVRERVFILFGTLEGGPSTAVLEAAVELKVPLFGPMAGSPILRRPHQPLVFPVRAEHREEFRALMAWGRSTGLQRVGFLHADTDVGREHLFNVGVIAKDLGMLVALPLPFKGEVGESTLAGMVKAIRSSDVELFFNHGSAGLYEKLIAAARQAGVRTTFMGVNSGSSQIVKGLGPLAQGMVFSQVVPSPWERKAEIAREYQDAARQANAAAEFSYGGLEGYATAKALVLALKACGREPTRDGFVKAVESSRFDLGGLTLRYASGDHVGSRYVDLSMVSREGRFIH